MNQKLVVSTKSLKNFLALFKTSDILTELTLGDTWHPSAGYVDEELLCGEHTVNAILKFPYDFIGLVSLQCELNNLRIEKIPSDYFDRETYEIIGTDYRLRDLANRIIEENMYNPGGYEYKFVDVYK